MQFERNDVMYKLNLIKKLRAEQYKEEQARLRRTILFTIYYGLLVVVFFFYMFYYLGLKEKRDTKIMELKKIERDIQSLEQSSEAITREDLQLLNRLQKDRIFWSKKMVVLASGLPESYWIESLGYRGEKLEVKGRGYISAKQEQLLVLDDYLAVLRNNKEFMQDFRKKQVELKFTKIMNLEEKNLIEYKFEVY
jgi:Tfp pilus assembly protein PilN